MTVAFNKVLQWQADCISHFARVIAYFTIQTLVLQLKHVLQFNHTFYKWNARITAEIHDLQFKHFTETQVLQFKHTYYNWNTGVAIQTHMIYNVNIHFTLQTLYWIICFTTEKKHVLQFKHIFQMKHNFHNSNNRRKHHNVFINYKLKQCELYRGMRKFPLFYFTIVYWSAHGLLHRKYSITSKCYQVVYILLYSCYYLPHFWHRPKSCSTLRNSIALNYERNQLRTHYLCGLVGGRIVWLVASASLSDMIP